MFSNCNHMRVLFRFCRGSENVFTINDELPLRIVSGNVKMKPGIKRFTTSGVEFTDGSLVKDVDVVVFATGFRLDFPMLEDEVVWDKDHQISLFKLVFPCCLEKNTLAVLGCLRPLGPAAPFLEMQARWVAQVLSVSGYSRDHEICSWYCFVFYIVSGVWYS